MCRVLDYTRVYNYTLKLGAETFIKKTLDATRPAVRVALPHPLMALAFPLDNINERFPMDVDERIETIQQSHCFGQMFVTLAQSMYQNDQFRGTPDQTLELIANQPGLTALMLAALQGDVTAARKLLRRGASVGLVNCYGRNALIMAAMAGRAEVVELLLSVDAAIDAVDAWDRNGMPRSVCTLTDPR